MKEFIFQILSENNFIPDRMWHSFQLLIVFLPIYLLLLWRTIREYRRCKKEALAEDDSLDWIDVIENRLTIGWIASFFFILLYSVSAAFDLTALIFSFIIWILN